jgi:uncharacterized protein YoxC
VVALATDVDDIIRLLQAIQQAGETVEDVSAAAKPVAKSAKKVKRKASAYAKRYGREFKRLAPKYKLKSGGWKKGGFKACQKAAHKAAKGGKK